VSSPPDLSQVSLFSGLPPQEIAALAALFQRRRYKKAEVIFRQGDPGLLLYIVESGEVRLSLTSAAGKEIILALVGPGGLFGELAVLDGEPRSSDAAARVTTWLLSLHRDPFIGFLKAHPDAAIGVITALSHRVRRTTEYVQDGAFLDVPARLARVLLRLAASGGQGGPDGVVLAPQLSQGELGDIIGATRESVNKWLAFFERQEVIRRDKGLVRVLRPEELKKRIY
jgi:CRP-like cAMP-binding protein